MNFFLITQIWCYSGTIHIDSAVVLYNFHSARGQIVEDSSGNGYHGVSGSSVGIDSSDVLFTDRGAFFQNSHVHIAPPSIVNKPAPNLSESFGITVWAMPTSHTGYIAGKENLIGLFLY